MSGCSFMLRFMFATSIITYVGAPVRRQPQSRYTAPRLVTKNTKATKSTKERTKTGARPAGSVTRETAEIRVPGLVLFFVNFFVLLVLFVLFVLSRQLVRLDSSRRSNQSR